jgi:hypothetical protein
MLKGKRDQARGVVTTVGKSTPIVERRRGQLRGKTLKVASKCKRGEL